MISAERLDALKAIEKDEKEARQEPLWPPELQEGGTERRTLVCGVEGTAGRNADRAPQSLSDCPDSLLFGLDEITISKQ